MLNAAIKDCPVFGGKLKSFDAAAIDELPGVKKVVRVGDSAVAVVADTWWRAKTALDALPIDWDEGAERRRLAAPAIAAMLKAGLDAPEAVVGNQQRRRAAPRWRGARASVEAVYAYPHQNHATMEPMNATARWTPERCEVWTPTQNGEAALAATAEAAGLPPAQCEVYKIHLGGGFGRRGAVHDWVRQAVAIAKADARHAGQADLVARGGHAARPLPPGHAVQADGRAGRAGQPHGAAHAHLRPVDPGRRVPAEHAERPRPGGVPGPERAGAGGVDRLQRSRTC